MNEVLQIVDPDPRMFATRLACISKTTSKFPKLTDTRPLAVTNLPQKILKKKILEVMSEQVSSKLSPTQFEFQPGRETLMQVIRLIDRLDTIRTDKHYKSGVKQLVFFDFSSAFDTIVHKELVKKCEEQMSCTLDLIGLLKWYVNQIHVRFGVSMINQNRESPQGGIVSPLLWLIYVNDFLEDLTSLVGQRNIFAYADDILIVCEDQGVTEEEIRRTKK